MLAFTLVTLVLVAALVIAIASSVHERVVTPLALFFAIEVFAVWPGLVPSWSVNGVISSPFPLITAASALLAFVVAYVITGGSSASVARWRDPSAVPNVAIVRQVRIGLILWVILLLAVETYRFQGLPPLLTGGLSGLIDPAANTDSVVSIRETRRELTKGHLVMGEEYAGQGALNALTSTGWTTVVVVATLLATWMKGRKGAIFAACIFTISFIYLGSAGSRGPILLAAVAVISCLSVRYRVPGKAIAAIAVSMVGLLLFVMPLSKGVTGGETLGERFSAAIERISEGNGQNNAMIVFLVDNGSLPIMWGHLFVERTVAMLPGTGSESVPFALRLTYLAYGGGANTTGYSTPTQYGLLYADGGPALVIAGYAVMGVLIALAWKYICRREFWFTPVLVAQGGLVLGYTSVTGIHGIPPSAAMMAIGLIVVNVPVGRLYAKQNMSTSGRKHLRAGTRVKGR